MALLASATSQIKFMHTFSLDKKCWYIWNGKQGSTCTSMNQWCRHFALYVLIISAYRLTTNLEAHFFSFWTWWSATIFSKNRCQNISFLLNSLGDEVIYFIPMGEMHCFVYLLCVFVCVPPKHGYPLLAKIAFECQNEIIIHRCNDLDYFLVW